MARRVLAVGRVERRVLPLPPDIPWDEGTFIELACVMRVAKEDGTVEDVRFRDIREVR